MAKKFTAEIIGAERLSDAIRDRLTTIANTGNYNQAIAAMEQAFKTSQSVKDWGQCPYDADDVKIHRCASEAVFFYRMRKYENGKRVDSWPAGKLNTEFAMYCTGKSKEEIETLYLDFLNK